MFRDPTETRRRGIIVLCLFCGSGEHEALCLLFHRECRPHKAIQDYKTAVSQSHRRANLIKCQSLSALQAALYLLCCRVGGDLCLVWVESAVVIRVAQAQGVHRDGSNFGLSPFGTEIRRRLWWHIRVLGMLSSRDQGADT